MDMPKVWITDDGNLACTNVWGGEYVLTFANSVGGPEVIAEMHRRLTTEPDERLRKENADLRAWIANHGVLTAGDGEQVIMPGCQSILEAAGEEWCQRPTPSSDADGPFRLGCKSKAHPSHVWINVEDNGVCRVLESLATIQVDALNAASNRWADKRTADILADYAQRGEQIMNMRREREEASAEAVDLRNKLARAGSDITYIRAVKASECSGLSRERDEARAECERLKKQLAESEANREGLRNEVREHREEYQKQLRIRGSVEQRLHEAERQLADRPQTCGEGAAYYMVHRRQSPKNWNSAPTKQHESLTDAVAEAMRLTRKCCGDIFDVLAVVKSYRASDPTVEEV